MPVHPNSIANLIPHKPGEPPINPNGRPKGSKNLINLMRDKLDDMLPDGSMSVGERMLEILIERSIKDNNPKIINSYLDRVYGKAIQQMVIEQSDTNTYQMQFGGVSIGVNEPNDTTIEAIPNDDTPALPESTE